MDRLKPYDRSATAKCMVVGCDRPKARRDGWFCDGWNKVHWLDIVEVVKDGGN